MVLDGVTREREREREREEGEVEDKSILAILKKKSVETKSDIDGI
jgi:hypothetical protein